LPTPLSASGSTPVSLAPAKGLRPARLRAAFNTRAPSWTTGVDFNNPSKAPTGVLAPDTITTSLMSSSSLLAGSTPGAQTETAVNEEHIPGQGLVPIQLSHQRGHLLRLHQPTDGHVGEDLLQRLLIHALHHRRTHVSRSDRRTPDLAGEAPTEELRGDDLREYRHGRLRGRVVELAGGAQRAGGGDEANKPLALGIDHALHTLPH